MTLDGRSEEIERGIKTSNNENIKLSELNIRNIYVDHGSWSSGTGIDVVSSTNLIIENLTSSDNGGAGLFLKGLNMSIKNINTNNNPWGGVAISNDGDYFENTSTITIDGNNNFNDTVPIYIESNQEKENISYGFNSSFNVTIKDNDYKYALGDIEGVDSNVGNNYIYLSNSLDSFRGNQHPSGVTLYDLLTEEFVVIGNLSIQDAINEASEGDTVLVGEGTYDGFTINKSLDVNANPNSGAKITDSIHIKSNNVTLTGFEVGGMLIETQEDEEGVQGLRGINVASQVVNATILNNYVQGFRTGLTPNEGTTNLTVRNNTFVDNTAGIGSTETSENITIVGNNFIQNDEGIGLATEEGTLENNSFTDNDVQIGLYTNKEVEGTVNVSLTQLRQQNTFDKAVLVQDKILSSIKLSQEFDTNTTTNASTVNQNASTFIGDTESSIDIFENTTIKRLDNKSIIWDEVVSSLENATEFNIDGESSTSVIQWGLENKTLEFNPEITVRLDVGTQFNGEELEVRRSVNGSDWTTNGLVQTTCTVQQGICEFQTNQASFFGAYQEPQTTTSSSGGISGGSSGGGGFFVSSDDESTEDDETQEASTVDADDEPVETEGEVVEPGQPVVIDGEQPEQDTETAEEETEGTVDAPTGLGGFITANTPTITTGVIGFLLIIGIGGYAYMKRREN